MAAKATETVQKQIEHLEQLKKNRQQKLKRLESYQGDPAHAEESKARTEAEIKQIDDELKALKKDNP